MHGFFAAHFASVTPFFLSHSIQRIPGAALPRQRKEKFPVACNQTKNCAGGCYGTLNTVAGPLVNCGCGCANPQYYQNYPFYNGPCGCVDCRGRDGWRHHHHPCWNDCGHPGHCWNGCAPVNTGVGSGAAHFVSPLPVMVEAGGAVPLAPEICGADYELCPDGAIRICRPGVYMAIHSLHVPALQTLSTQLYLSLNGSPLESSAQDVARIADGTSGGSTRHVLFRAWPNSDLRLISSGNISVGDAQGGVSPFSLTLIRLE